MTFRRYQISRNKDKQVNLSQGFRFVAGSEQSSNGGGQNDCTYCFLPAPEGTDDIFVAKDNQWVGPFGLVITGGLGGSQSNPVGRLTRISVDGVPLPLVYHPMFE